MLGSAEIVRGIEGAVRFLSRDATAPSYFDNTREACLRSFQVMILATPVYALYLIVHYMQAEVAASAAEIAFIEALHFTVDWLLYPVLFYEIARRRGWLDRFPRYISALNWINLPIIASVLLFEMVDYLAGPSTLVSVLGIGVQGMFFYWLIVAARLCLGVGWGTAFLLLIVNWVPSYFLLVLVDRILDTGDVSAAAVATVLNFQ